LGPANGSPTALQTANTDLGVTVLVVSHDPAVAARVRRTVAIRDGRTSTEWLRHATTDEFGNATQHAVEYAVMDRAGRVQLPREMTQPRGMRDRVRLEAEPGFIAVWPDRPPEPLAAEPPGTPAAEPPGTPAAEPPDPTAAGPSVRPPAEGGPRAEDR
jgi:putative ABC transport system ATP-binding protein